MALIKCPECQLQVSDKAIICPHCGYPLDTKVIKQQQRKLINENVFQMDLALYPN
jgi:Uncharacterised protein family UPF0547